MSGNRTTRFVEQGVYDVDCPDHGLGATLRGGQ